MIPTIATMKHKEHLYPPPPAAQRGFTLLELLVALFIFSLLSAFSYQAINGMLASDEQLQAEAHRLSNIQRTLMVWERDVRQAHSDGQLLPESGSTPGVLMEVMQNFSSGNKPVATPSEDSQRVRYVLEKDHLYRQTVDASGELLQSLLLLEQVASADIKASKRESLGGSDPAPPLAGAAPRLPDSLELVLTFDSAGRVRRFVYLGLEPPDWALNTLDNAQGGNGAVNPTRGNTTSDTDFANDPLGGVLD